MPLRAWTPNVAPAPVVGHPTLTQSTSYATQLRYIAEQLRAMVECGDFGLCFDGVRTDMATLPDSLMRLAREMEPDDDGVASRERG